MIQLMADPALTVTYIYGGLFATEEEWRHPARTIDSYELLYVVAGEVFLEEEGERFRLKEGDVYLLRPDCRHGGYASSRGRTSFYWVHFLTNDWPGLGIGAGLLCVPDSYRFSLLLKQLLHIANAPGYPPYTLDAALALLLAELAAAGKGRESGAVPLVYEVAEWIRIHSREMLTVKGVADRFGYHPDYLCTLFQKNMGMPLKRYISGERVKLVQSLLLTSGKPLKELAEELGWESENAFVHYIRYHTGMGPARFRRLYYHTHMNDR